MTLHSENTQCVSQLLCSSYAQMGEKFWPMSKCVVLNKLFDSSYKFLKFELTVLLSTLLVTSCGFLKFAHKRAPWIP